MPKHFYLLLVSTLIIGFASGAYVYYLTRSSDGGTIPGPEPLADIEIVAGEYGGCERLGCTAYRLSEDGSYTFIRYNSRDGDARFEGMLTTKKHERLLNLLPQTDFVGLAGTTFTGTCPPTYDGIAYTYEIRNGGETYTFDSCREDLGGDPFFVELNGYFVQFNSEHGVQ